MARKSVKNQSELITFATPYCLHVNQVNIPVSYNSVITYLSKSSEPLHIKIQGKTELVM